MKRGNHTGTSERSEQAAEGRSEAQPRNKNKDYQVKIKNKQKQVNRVDIHERVGNEREQRRRNTRRNKEVPFIHELRSTYSGKREFINPNPSSGTVLKEMLRPILGLAIPAPPSNSHGIITLNKEQRKPGTPAGESESKRNERSSSETKKKLLSTLGLYHGF